MSASATRVGGTLCLRLRIGRRAIGLNVRRRCPCLWIRYWPEADDWED